MFLNRKNNVDRFRSLELKIILSTKKKRNPPKKGKKGFEHNGGGYKGVYVAYNQ